MTPRQPLHALESFGFSLFRGAMCILPHGAAIRCGGWIGGLAFRLGVRRRVAVQNVLERLQPAGGSGAAERIALESYRVAGRTFAHLLRADRIRDETLWRIIPRADIEALVAARGSGSTIFVSGHFGNWELAVIAIRRCGVPLGALAGEQSNANVGAAVGDIRARIGVPTVSARSGLRDAISYLREGKSLVTLPDQDARSKGVFVEFLGTQASAHVGVASLAQRTGATLTPFAVVDEAGRYSVVRGTVWRADTAASRDENERAGAEHFHRFLEEQVRRHPENYFWAHRRWKTRPPALGEETP